MRDLGKALPLLILTVCAFISGCRGSETLWSGEARSPDGNMIASARTVAQSGFGTGYVGTIVYLNWSKGSQRPIEILGLSYASEASGATGVQMKWIDPTHLELIYDTPRNLDFQAAKCAGVDISVREIHREEPDSSL